MAPKRGIKRKVAGSAENISAANGDDMTTIAPPDAKTWPGFVEMESNPVSCTPKCSPRWRLQNAPQLTRLQAFFNQILGQSGIKGIKIQELYETGPDMVAFLPYVSPGFHPIFPSKSSPWQQHSTVHLNAGTLLRRAHLSRR